MKSRSHPSLGNRFRKPPACHFLGSTSGACDEVLEPLGVLVQSSLNRSSASRNCAIIALVASTFAFVGAARELLDHEPARIPMMTITTIIRRG
jgi:hypothetical protein